MPPFTLSIVIPALNEAARIDAVVRQAAQASGLDSVEVVVVDGGSNDATAAIARKQARVVHGRRGRALQMNAGARAVAGDTIVFCHADTLLPAGYGVDIQQALQNLEVVGGAFSPRFVPQRRLLRPIEWILRLPLTLLMFGDQAIFVRRSAFEAVGGFRNLPLMEDVAFVGSLRRLGRLVRLGAPVRTSSRRFIERGVVRQLLLDLALLGAYHLGASPVRLARHYFVTRRDPPPQ